MDELCSLSRLLSCQIEVINKINDLEREKTRILVKGSIDQLDHIILEQQPLIMQSGNLEKQRQDLQNKIGIGDYTLKRIIAEYASGNNFDLKGIYAQLSALLIKLKKRNDVNGEIIHSRLNKIKLFLPETQISEGVLTYSK